MELPQIEHRPQDGGTVDLSAVRRIALVMYAGAIFGLTCAIFGPDPDPSDHTAFAVIIGLELVMGCIIATRRRLTLGLFRASSLYGIVTTLLCVAVARPTNGVPLYTIWPLLLSAYALPRRDFIALLGTAVVGSAVAIGVFLEPPARLNLWLDTALTVGFAALVVRFLRETLDTLVSGLHDVARRLQDTARRDGLTGVANRRAFEDEVRILLDRGDRLSLVLLDLDHFKQINDQYGHAAGDAALRTFVDVARGDLRDGDLLGRVGGEEFALALPGADAVTAERIARRLAGRVRGRTAAGPVPLTVSGGVAQRGPGVETTEALLAAADRALYRAKEAGRRRIAVDGTDAVGTEVASLPDTAGPDHEPWTGPDGDTAVDLVRRRLDERRLMLRVAAYQCAAAVPAMAASALLPDVSSAKLTLIGALCLLLAMQALVLFAVHDLPLRVLRAMPYGGIAVIALAVAINDPIGGTPYFFLWPAVYAGYFFGRRHLWAVVATISVVYAGVLAAWVEAPLRTSDFTTVMVPVIVAGLAVAILRERVGTLVDQLDAKLAELEEAASHDVLTGVLNRRAFDGLLAREVERARLEARPLSLVAVDVDHFKQVNDAHGHAAGDEALALIAGALRDAAGPGDAVARLGGEEFAVIAVGSGADEGARLADRIGPALAARAAGHPAALTVSCGVAQLADDLATTDRLAAAADRALYAAKSAGRARTAVWGRDCRPVPTPSR